MYHSLCLVVGLDNFGSVRVLSIVESREDFDVDISSTSDAFNSTDQPLLESATRIGVGALSDSRTEPLRFEWTREEVCKSQDAIVMQISGLKNVVARQVLLFSGNLEAWGRTNIEVSALVLVQHATEDRWRVKVRPVKLSIDDFGMCNGRSVSYQHIISTPPSIALDH